MFYLEKTRFTFSGDYTFIVSKAYFISFKYIKSNYTTNHSQLKPIKTNTKSNNLTTLGKHTPQKEKKLTVTLEGTAK